MDPPSKLLKFWHFAIFLQSFKNAVIVEGPSSLLYSGYRERWYTGFCNKCVFHKPS